MARPQIRSGLLSTPQLADQGIGAGIALELAHAGASEMFAPWNSYGSQPFVRKHFRKVAVKCPENKQKSH